MQKRKLIFVLGAAAAVVIAALYFRAASGKPPSRTVQPAQSAQVGAGPPAALPPSRPFSSGAGQSASPGAAAPALPPAAASSSSEPAPGVWERSAFLTVTPEAVTLSLEHGQSAAREIELRNSAAEDLHLTIHGLAAGTADLGAAADLLLARKAEEPPDGAEREALAEVVYAGPPWFSVYPAALVLRKGAAAKVRVALNTAAPAADTLRAQLLILGRRAGEARSVPVMLAVKPAPVLRMARYEVADGGSAETEGDQNRVANAGETVALAVDLENFGTGAAAGLKLELSAEDPAVEIIGARVVYVPEAPPRGRIPAVFRVRVNAQAHPTIPPTVYLTTTDRDGRQWFEHFYLGEDGAFEYPTGLTPPKTDEAAADVQRKKQQP